MDDARNMRVRFPVENKFCLNPSSLHKFSATENKWNTSRSGGKNTGNASKHPHSLSCSDLKQLLKQKPQMNDSLCEIRGKIVAFSSFSVDSDLFRTDPVRFPLLGILQVST